jgi:hypothetical protein
MTIYVLRSKHLVKIGVTENLRVRLSSYRSMAPMEFELVGHMPGDIAVEQHLHDRFSAHHLSGEWFVETAEMRAVFDAILDPEMPIVVTEKTRKRRDPSDVTAISEQVKTAAAHRWPTDGIGTRISHVAHELGWTRNRVRDLFYADPRIVIRAAEQEELSRWLALWIAPELRGDE